MAEEPKKSEPGIVRKAYDAAAGAVSFVWNGALPGLVVRKTLSHLATSEVGHRIEKKMIENMKEELPVGSPAPHVQHSSGGSSGLEAKVEDFIARRLANRASGGIKEYLHKSEAERKIADAEWLANKEQVAKGKIQNPLLIDMVNGPLGHYRDSLMLPTSSVVTNGVHVDDHAGAPATPAHLAPKEHGKGGNK